MRRKLIRILVVFSVVLLAISAIIASQANKSGIRVLKLASTELSKHIKSEQDKFFGLSADSTKPAEIFKRSSTRNLLYFEKKHLEYWSGDDVFYDSSFFSLPPVSFQRYAKGFFVVLRQPFGKGELVKLIPIRSNYPFENQYLKNEFSISVPGQEHLRITEANASGGDLVKDKDGLGLFRLKLNRNVTEVQLNSWLCWAGYCSLLGLFLWMMAFSLIVRKESNLSILGIGIVLPIVIIHFFESSFGLDALSLFQPDLFATPILGNSLGDLLVNAWVFMIVFHFIFEKINFPERFNYLKTVIAFAVFYFILFWVSEALVLHASLDIGSDKILNLNQYGVLAYLLLGAIILQLSRVFHVFIKTYFKEKYFNILFLSIISFCITAYFANVYYGLLSGILISTTAFLNLRLEGAMRKSFLLFSLFSLMAAISIIEARNIFLENTSKAYTRRLQSPDDPLAIYLISEMIENMQQDQVLINLLTAGDASRGFAISRISLMYLNGYLDKYLLESIQFRGRTDLQSISLEELLAADRFGLIDPEPVRNNSGFRIQIPLIVNSQLDTLQILLGQKAIRSQSPFPRVFIEGDWRDSRYATMFDFARYYKGKLIQMSGNYPFDSKLQDENPSEEVFFKNGYHLLYTKADAPEQTILVAWKNGGFLNFITHFLLVLFCAGILGFWLVINRIRHKNYFSFTYRRRIENAMIISVSGALLIVALVTIQYTSVRNKKIQSAQNKDKVKDLLPYVESELQGGFENGKLSNSAEINLAQLASNYICDIVLYDSNGFLVFTTQKNISSDGFMSNLMPFEVAEKILRGGAIYYNGNESIGSLNYLSAYASVKNGSGDVIAALNIPFFTSEELLKDNITAFIETLLSIYFFFLLIFVVLTAYLSGKITKPLGVLSNIIANTGKNGAKAVPDWQRSDEIGEILKSYKNMLLQLEHNATLLAESEKEKAWRQMARQVAHEIRNPLTPIKLSVQHLSRAWLENSPRFGDMMDRVPATILQQIDQLNNIATEFSEFAQMPIGEPTRVDIQEICSEIVDLYQESASIILDNQLADKTFIWADRNQILRALSNIVKNGIQAKDQSENSEIKIVLSVENNIAQISIKDNGGGFDEETAAKIFVPNFTTKSSGMGLGLPIVKKIVDLNNGEIRFTSFPAMGTTFYLNFPILQQDADMDS